MIDDDSNELIPFEGGDGDADASTGNNNPDDTQSVTIIQDEQGIVFLGDAGTIDLWSRTKASVPKRSQPKPYRPSPRPAKAHKRSATPWPKAGVG